MPRKHQRNEAIGVQDLVTNSRRLSYMSSYDGLWPPSIWQIALYVSSVSLTDWEMLHVVTEWRQLWLLCDQPWGSKIIYKCFQEFTAFLNCRYKTLIISGPLCECMPDPYRIHLLTTKCVMKNLLASRKPRNLLIRIKLFKVVRHVK